MTIVTYTVVVYNLKYAVTGFCKIDYRFGAEMFFENLYYTPSGENAIAVNNLFCFGESL